MSSLPTVLIYAENTPQPQQERYEAAYPSGIGATLAGALREQGFRVRMASTTDPENGMSEAALEGVDVVLYWSHKAHHLIEPAVTERLHERVLRGMGLVFLHSSMGAPLFRRLMGTSCRLYYRNHGERERVWAIDPQHPISAGLDPCFELEGEEMYSEPFDVPTPDELVFVSWFEGGEVFRSGLTYQRGAGRIFYFRPGHETYPTYHNAEVHKVLRNAVRWAHNPGKPWTTVGEAPNVPIGKAREPLVEKGPKPHSHAPKG